MLWMWWRDEIFRFSALDAKSMKGYSLLSCIYCCDVANGSKHLKVLWKVSMVGWTFLLWVNETHVVKGETNPSHPSWGFWSYWRRKISQVGNISLPSSHSWNAKSLRIVVVLWWSVLQPLETFEGELPTLIVFVNSKNSNNKLRVTWQQVCKCSQSLGVLKAKFSLQSCFCCHID